MALNSLSDRVRRHRGWLLAGAVLAPLGLSIVFVPLRTSFSNIGAALSMVAVIEAVAILGNRLEGVLATLSAALWFDFFLTVPYGRLTISHRPDLETTISIVVIGVIVTELAARGRRHRRAADEESRFVVIMRDAAEMCAGVNEWSDVTEFVTRSLVEVLELRVCRFDARVAEPPLARIHPGGDVMHVGLRWPVHEIGLPGPEIEILCRHRGEVVGRFVLTPTPGLVISRERRIVAVALTSLVAPILRDARSPREPV